MMYLVKDLTEPYIRICIYDDLIVVNNSTKLPNIMDIIRDHEISHYLISFVNHIKDNSYNAYLAVDDDEVSFAILCGLTFYTDDRMMSFVLHHRNFLFKDV